MQFVFRLLVVLHKEVVSGIECNGCSALGVLAGYSCFADVKSWIAFRCVPWLSWLWRAQENARSDLAIREEGATGRGRRRRVEV